MTDIPIIMSAPMVLALLAGRKTMTRRLAERMVLDKLAGQMITVASHWQDVRPGDRLWVRETHQAYGVWKSFKGRWTFEHGYPIEPQYCKFEDPQRHVRKRRSEFMWWNRPAIFMPRAFSRLTLEVKATKLEPLQAISAGDAVSEGLEWRDDCGWGVWNADGTMRCGGGEDPIDAFRCLWTNLHGTDGDGAWKANPEVVALSLGVVSKAAERPDESTPATRR